MSTVSPIDTHTRLGVVSLVVAELDRAVRFYEQAIGLRLHERHDGRALLGVEGATLVELVEEPGATPVDRSTGLFHLALLLPTRSDLAAWVQHAIDDHIPVEGASDHVVSEAIYLSDPDGHGIELYADRGREIWEGKVQELMTTLALDLPSLLAEVDPAGSTPYAGLPVGTTIGHVHLKVAEMPATIDWFRDVLGFELMATYGPQAAFLGASGYHHHIGANTWLSAGQNPSGPGTARLGYVTVVLPDLAERERVLKQVRAAGGTTVELGDAWQVLDPSGNALRLVAG
jgi:catechol 2,3-dioxygenase